MNDYSEILEVVYTNKDSNLYTLSTQKKVLLFFLRHFGCVYCRQSMSDLSQNKRMIERAGMQIVVVHMSSDKIAEDYLKHYDLEEVEHVSDPDMSLYHLFGLNKGTFMELYNLHIMIKGAFKAIKYGTEVQSYLGDFKQMPGICLLDKGELEKRFSFKDASVRVEYKKIIQVIKSPDYHTQTEIILR